MVAKMWSMVLQMVLLVQCHQIMGLKVKREPYAVEEMGHEFSSGGDIGGYSPWSEGFGSQGGGVQFIKAGGGGGGGGGGFGGYSGHFGGIGGFGMHDSGSGGYGSFGGGSFGKLIISEGGHDGPSEGKSISELQEEAHSKLKTLILESKINQKLAEDKVEKLKKSFGYGTFGYEGYQYPIKPGPIDLGTHHAVDLGTALDSNSIKDSNGKLKLPVQTVFITKTVGVPIPEPYPIKHEVAVPAPYPVPIPTHFSGESYPSSYSSDYSSDGGKSSYQSAGDSVSKVVDYHENLSKASDKQYSSASTNYARYLPYRSSSSAFRKYYSPKQSVYEF